MPKGLSRKKCIHDRKLKPFRIIQDNYIKRYLKHMYERKRYLIPIISSHFFSLFAVAKLAYSPTMFNRIIICRIQSSLQELTAARNGSATVACLLFIISQKAFNSLSVKTNILPQRFPPASSWQSAAQLLLY